MQRLICLILALALSIAGARPLAAVVTPDRGKTACFCDATGTDCPLCHEARRTTGRCPCGPPPPSRNTQQASDLTAARTPSAIIPAQRAAREHPPFRSVDAPLPNGQRHACVSRAAPGIVRAPPARAALCIWTV